MYACDCVCTCLCMCACEWLYTYVYACDCVSVCMTDIQLWIVGRPCHNDINNKWSLLWHLSVNKCATRVINARTFCGTHCATDLRCGKKIINAFVESRKIVFFPESSRKVSEIACECVPLSTPRTRLKHISDCYHQ